MAKKKISGLPASGALTGTEIVPIVQSGTTKRTTTQDIADLGGGGGGISGSGTENFISKWSDGTTLTDSLFFSDDNIAKTIWDTTDKGLYLDFTNNKYEIGLPNTKGLRIDIANFEYSLGDYTFENTGTTLIVDEGAEIIKTSNQGADKGLYIKFDETLYSLGIQNGDPYLISGFSRIGESYYMGDNANLNSSTLLSVLDNDGTIKTSSGGADKGLYLDFANNKYEIGLPNTKGLRIDIANFEYSLGDYTFENTGTTLIVDEGAEIIKTSNQGADKGLFIDFANGIYALGFTETGDFVGEDVIGIKTSSNNTTIGDTWSYDSNIDINFSDSKISLNSNRTNFRNLTTTAINALTGNQSGDVVYNSTLNTLCFYNGTSWQKVNHANM